VEDQVWGHGVRNLAIAGAVLMVVFIQPFSRGRYGAFALRKLRFSAMNRSRIGYGDNVKKKHMTLL
jgi:hypothetical protein